MHPKTEIRSDPESMQKILNAGWVAQLKIHGHRAQIHISGRDADPIRVYNRQGQLHKMELSDLMQSELRRVFGPQVPGEFNVLDAEWLKPEGKIFVFDLLKQDGKLLRHLPFKERYKLLPRAYLSPVLQTLPLLQTLEECQAAMVRPEEWIEGLVFKSSAPGFEDTSIIRCRKKQPQLP